MDDASAWEWESIRRALYALRLEWQAMCDERKANFNPAQPRVPRGHADGGQWVYAGLGQAVADRYLPRQVLTSSSSTYDRYVGVKPVFVPHDVDMDAHIRQAMRHRGQLGWFTLMVMPGGAWDYKKLDGRYEDFGNFHYGLIGRSVGLTENTLLRAAGTVQVFTGTSRPGFGEAANPVDTLNGVGGRPPYGDDRKDQYWIQRGFEYYDFYKRERLIEW